MNFNVAIIGGGPAGSTAATLLKKYDPSLEVAVFERENFPRDHVGESQLPAISKILAEMGVWEKVEEANFPIKIGSTNRWGKKAELWDFEFIPASKFVDEPRPASFAGQRRHTAFQVDRAVYDKILLDHAKSVGVQVFEGVGVDGVQVSGDRIDSLDLSDGNQVTAEFFVDASGHGGIARKALGVKSNYPTSLKNIALWDYWENAEWAEEIGVGGTKVQVMSLEYGWIWFIPLSATRTSIGLILPADYYKKSKTKPLDLYLDSIAKDERISGLTRAATREGKFQSTSDWSFLAERHAGENWFLAGESGGFADPILAAGMTMAHAAGREVAFTILESIRGGTDRKWLAKQYEIRQSKRINSHIRFADYWYTANTQFSDLKEFTKELAKDVGLDLDPDKAWRWLATGGFIDETLSVGTGGFSLFSIKMLGSFLSELPSESPLDGKNIIKLDLANATWQDYAEYGNGRVLVGQSYSRDGKVLPVIGPCEVVLEVLQRTSNIEEFFGILQRSLERDYADLGARNQALINVVEALEGMATDGWVSTGVDPSRPRRKIRFLAHNIKTKELPPAVNVGG